MKPLVRALATLAAALAVWWLAVAVFRIPSFLLPSPETVVAKIWFLARSADLARHLATTLTEIALGFALGAVLALLCGWAFHRIPWLGRAASAPILLLQTAPKIAIAPLLLLWLGLGLGPKVVLIAIVVFFPVLAGTVAGLSGIEGSYRELGRLLRLSPWTMFRRIELPFSLPPVFAGLRIGSTQAVTAAVVGELMGATYGLGYLLSVGQESGDAGVVLAAILILSTLGWFLHELVRAAEARLLGWHESRQIVQEA